jgi:uncharacterized protein (DUF362 family)/NAD-dependent dihydropyrimidine dehydrogenase PreA subunit
MSRLKFNARRIFLEVDSMQVDFSITAVENTSVVKSRIREALEPWTPILPANRAARILLKPNFNSNFNALTGNTTDLRLLAGVIEFLQSKGFSDITIGEGTNSGFVREGISVIHRLRADKLAAAYGVKMVDLNAWPDTVKVPLENGDVVEVASLLATSDFIVNMPKLKTHYEVGMSVCMKNLIGTCRGRENKKKIHGNLGYNIVHLNQVVKPNLHIVDGLIGMEGNGPSRGMPVHFGKIVIGTSPYKVDYLCARLIGFAPNEVKPIAAALKLGLIKPEEARSWDEIPIDPYRTKFMKPKVSPLVAFVINPKFQRHLIKIRYSPVIKQICSSDFVKDIFYKLGISQERIQNDEAALTFRAKEVDCGTCAKCEEYCPLGIERATILGGGGDRCINCLYCCSVCPKDAFALSGNAGFYSQQISLYGEIIRRIA